MLILQFCVPNPQSLPVLISCQTNQYPSFLTSKLPSYTQCSTLYTNTNRVRTKCLQTQMEMNGFDGAEDDEVEDESEFSRSGGGFRGREDEEKDYDRDPEFAEIIGYCLDDPDKARSKMEERLRKKRNRILHTKTGSAKPMEVKFNKLLGQALQLMGLVLEHAIVLPVCNLQRILVVYFVPHSTPSHNVHPVRGLTTPR